MNFRLSIVTASLLLGASFSLTGCGGGGSGTTSTNGSAITSINGVLSDGPINNARVYIDSNHNGNYDIGEPVTQTDDSNTGKFSIDYLPDGTALTLSAEDINASASDKDNNGSYSFFLFSNGKNGNYNVNPQKMIENLQDLSLLEYVKNDFNLTDTNITTLNQTQIFAKLSKNENKNKLKKLIKDIFAKKQFNNSRLTKANKALNLDDNVTVSYMDMDTNTSDVNITKISQLLPTQTTPNVIRVGNNIAIVVSKKLKEVTPTSYNQNTSKLKFSRPIFAPITSIDATINLALKQAANYDQTIYITPYKSIIEIPNYEQLTKKGYQPIIATDVTVRDAQASKIVDTNKLINGVGIIDDKRQADLNSSANLVYLYLENGNWEKGADLNSTDFSAVLTKLRLLPYVIATETNSTSNKSKYKDVNITLSNTSLLSDALLVAKGENNVTLDYIASYKVGNNNVATFTVPSDFNITKIVVLDKNLKQLNQEAVATLDVNDSKADVGKTVSNILDSNSSAYNKVNSTINSLLNNNYNYSKSRIERGVFPWFVDNNNTLQGKVYTLGGSCLIDGNCSDPAYNNLHVITKEYGYTNEYTATTKDGTIQFNITSRYNDQSSSDSSPVDTETYSYTLSPYKISVTHNSESITESASIENIDKNSSMKVVYNSTLKVSDSPSSDSSYSTTTGTIASLAYFTAVKAQSGKFLSIRGDYLPKVSKNIQVNDTSSGYIASFYGILDLNDTLVLKADGTYSFKNSTDTIIGKYIQNKASSPVMTYDKTSVISVAQ